MLVVNESNLSDRCIPSILQLPSGQALLRTGQREYRPRNPVSSKKREMRKKEGFFNNLLILPLADF